MVHRDTPWPPGTPCWADVMTTGDAATERDFYRGLFGWEIEVGGPETGGYGIAQVDDRNVAGIGQMPEGHTAWTTYLATADAEATATAISAAGGTIVEPPMDVGTFGRMVLAVDPAGAFFGVWEAREHQGAQLANEPNSLIWNEVLTRDLAAARSFYESVFGWTFADLPGEAAYVTFAVDGQVAGGIGALPPGTPESVPSHWRTYFAVADCDAATARAVELGAEVVTEAHTTPFGRWSYLRDPQGAMFAVIA